MFLAIFSNLQLDCDSKITVLNKKVNDMESGSFIIIETIISEMIQICILYLCYASKVSDYEKYTNIFKSELCIDILLL